MDVFELVHDLIAHEVLTGATLSKPRRSDPARASRITIDPVLVGSELRYRWRHHSAARTTDENLAPDETERRLVHLIGGEFRQALLRATDADHQVLADGTAATVLRRPPTRPQRALAHDRRKRRLLEEGTAVPFLVELGVMTRDGTRESAHAFQVPPGQPFPRARRRRPARASLGPLRIVDFGSGKSYLTFALHHLLTAVRGREVDLVGLDLKEDVVATCDALARRLGAEGLHFEVGDIAGYGGDRADLVVSLHACDTATDAALERAVRWEAPVILAVPCCQHELSPQLENAALAPLLSRGLLRERFAADVTDAGRAQLLEAVGYDVQLVEFVELEHTPKNVLIRAVRRPGRDRAKSLGAYLSFKAALGIDPILEHLIGDLLPGHR